MVSRPSWELSIGWPTSDLRCGKVWVRPRACPVEAHARGYRRGSREAPRDKPAASGREAAGGSGERDPPHAEDGGEAVASGWLI
jgi:hypothetical protein